VKDFERGELLGAETSRRGARSTSAMFHVELDRSVRDNAFTF
jgi:hypothetical protein